VCTSSFAVCAYSYPTPMLPTRARGFCLARDVESSYPNGKVAADTPPGLARAAPSGLLLAAPAPLAIAYVAISPPTETPRTATPVLTCIPVVGFDAHPSDGCATGDLSALRTDPTSTDRRSAQAVPGATPRRMFSADITGRAGVTRVVLPVLLCVWRHPDERASIHSPARPLGAVRLVRGHVRFAKGCAWAPLKFH